MNKLDTLYAAFIEAALWSSVDVEGEPLDAAYDQEDIYPLDANEALSFCERFIRLAGVEAIEENGFAQAGHDLYLTCAGHGVGFWDGDWALNGEALTAICDLICGGIDLTEGDDGKTIYIDIHELRSKAA